MDLDADVQNAAAFAQASISLGPWVVISPGVRFAQWKGFITPESGERFLAVQDEGLDPRFGVTVNLSRDGSFVAKAHWGRYHQNMISQMFDRVQGADVFTNQEYWYYTGPPITDPTVPPDAINPDPPALGQARIGLHAAADPTITDAEVAEFAEMRPGIIKLLSNHNPEGIRKLAAQHPDVQWVVRAFLDFRQPGGTRTVSPQQFFDWTIGDMKRTLGLISSDVVIELHNEPNLVPEGLTGAWHDGSRWARSTCHR